MTNYPVASLVLTQHLWLIEKLDFEAALTGEFCLCSSSRGREFKNCWQIEKHQQVKRVAKPAFSDAGGATPQSEFERSERHNEIDIHLRDAL